MKLAIHSREIFTINRRHFIATINAEEEDLVEAMYSAVTGGAEHRLTVWIDLEEASDKEDDNDEAEESMNERVVVEGCEKIRKLEAKIKELETELEYRR